MASISRKPSNLPLSVSTTANPNMPTFFEPASNTDRLSKKKKSFSPFDRIKNAFSSRGKQFEPRGIVPLIVTPTEEPVEKIGDLKISYSAENVFNSDLKKSHETSTISVPSNMQKAVSNECLKSKEVKIAKLLRSSECLTVESDLGVVSSSLPKNLNKDEKHATLDQEVGDKSYLVAERIISEKSESLQKEESLATFSDLNEVSRQQEDLDHRAARHRKDLKPKGRRPPTVYLQSKTNHDIGTSKTFPSPTHKISSILKLNSSDNLTTTSEVHKEQMTAAETADDSKSSTLQQVKRNKSFAPQLDEIQKIRRKTIAIYQCEKNDEERKESSSEVKVIPPKPQRNTSFKFREELESSKVAEVSKIEKSAKATPLHTSTVEKLSSSGEIINGGDFASRRSHFMKVEDATAKDGVEVFQPSNKSEDFTKRPQSRFMQGSTPINIPGSFKNFKANHDGLKGSPESLAEVKKATESTVSEDASSVKSDKLSPPKKSDDKFIVNGQANKIPQPAFKKFYKPVPAAETSENQASNKYVPSKIETPPSKPEVQDADVAESFESARQKFGPKITKTPQVKSGDEASTEGKANQPPPAKFAFSKKQNEDKISPPKSDNQTSNPQANPVLTQFPKKAESKSPLQVAKQIPPEPFKVSTTESSKVSSDISPMKTSMKVKEVDSSVPTRFSSLKLSKENSSSTSKESEEIDLKQSDKPLTRAAAGINPKIIPNKLNFNPDDWMAKRRE